RNLSISSSLIRRLCEPPTGDHLATTRSAAWITLGLATALLTPAAPAQQRQPALKPVSSGYIPANGVNYYYEIYGRGAPLLLLYGGLGSIGMFSPILPQLTKGRQVDRAEAAVQQQRSEEHTSELQSRGHLVCRLL